MYDNAEFLRINYDDRGEPLSTSLDVDFDKFNAPLIRLPIEVLRLSAEFHERPSFIDHFLGILDVHFALPYLKEIRVPATLFIDNEAFPETYSSFLDGDITVIHYPFSIHSVELYKYYSAIPYNQADFVIEAFDQIGLKTVLDSLEKTVKELKGCYKKVVIEIESASFAFIDPSIFGMWRARAMKMSVEIRDLSQQESEKASQGV